MLIKTAILAQRISILLKCIMMMLITIKLIKIWVNLILLVLIPTEYGLRLLQYNAKIEYFLLITLLMISPQNNLCQSHKQRLQNKNQIFRWRKLISFYKLANYKCKY